MIYTLKNDRLTVQISSTGGEIMSVIGEGCEYIWQGNPEFWAARTPILFPICGRFFEQKYLHEGKQYEMGTHGFLRFSELCVVSSDEKSIVFSMTQNQETLKQYPFDFKLTVSYTLDGNKISSTATIENSGDVTLPATFGAHPGFNVPLDNGAFEDWYLEFSEDCTPNLLMFSDTCFNTGRKKPYPLKDSRVLPLSHDHFAIDALFFDRIAPSVTLKSDKSARSVTLNYADMPFLGIWHKPRTTAPYVCIEPWCGLPAYDFDISEIMQKNDMFHILPGRSKSVSYEMIFN